MSSVADETYRLLLLGKTGDGKSKTGNTILRDEIFCVGGYSKSETAECKHEQRTRNGIKIEVIDAPGLFDTKQSHQQVGNSIMQAVVCMYPGPTAILYVIRVRRYTEEDFAVYQRLKTLFDEALSKYMIILFTGGDDLTADKINIKDYIDNAIPPLKKVLKDCNNRYIVFNNRLQGEESDLQVNDLLAMVSDLNIQNNNVPYVCTKYGAIGKGIEKEVERRLGDVEMQELEQKKQFQEMKRQKELAEEAVAKERAIFEEKEKERNEKMKETLKRNEEKIKQLRLQMEKENLSEKEKATKEKAMREQMEKDRKEERERNEKEREKDKKKIEEVEKQRKEFEHRYNEVKQKYDEIIKARDAVIWELKKQAEKRNYGVLSKIARAVIPFFAVIQDEVNK